MFTSNTTAITVEAVNDTLQNSLLDTPGGFHAIGLVVDGTNYSAGFQLGIDIGNIADITLSGWSAGTHTFELVEGQRFILSSTKRGTPLLRFGTDAGSSFSVVAPTAPAKRIVVTGDSIASGQVITTSGHAAPYDAWPMVMRKNAGASVSGTWGGAHVINDSIAGWQLHQMANDATTVAALTAQCDGTGSNLWILALGQNDYAGSIAAATFQNDVGVLLDAFHTAVPGASVLVLTPFNNTSEFANGAGRTLGDYRTDEANACTARSAYCTVMNGPGVLTAPGDLTTDGIHPNTTGMAKIEPAVRTAIGY